MPTAVLAPCALGERPGNAPEIIAEAERQFGAPLSFLLTALRPLFTLPPPVEEAE
jgi:hypothetical protein